MSTGIWFQSAHDRKAHVAVVNGRYRWQVWELWLDRWGERAYPGRLVGMASARTLAGAKHAALRVLDRSKRQGGI